MSAAPVVTRFAPSPTGELHLGNARTALFSWLLARRTGGRFVLRIEDTDATRSRPEHARALVEELRWLGLDWDEGPDVGGPNAPYLQSERAAFYDDGFRRLESLGRTYPCFCTPLELELARKAQLAAGRPPRYAGTCRDLTPAQRAAHVAAGRAPTTRFRVEDGRSVEFDDLVHGPQRFATHDIGDFVIRRADGSAAFFFCNALDDSAMGITHVLRGEDHLTNTPRQLMLLEALGRAAPRYGHVALLTGDDGAPLSKRNGALSLRELRERGHLPQAIVNHLFRLGHSSPLQALSTLPELAAAFDPAHLGRAPARFDPRQLAVWQRDAAHALTPERALEWLAPVLGPVPADERRAFVAAVRANVELPADVTYWTDVVYGAEPPSIDEEAGRTSVREAGPGFFAAAAAAVGQTGNDWTALAAATGRATGRRGAALFKPLRWALTGRGHGPELGPLLALVRPETLRARLERFARPA